MDCAKPGRWCLPVLDVVKGFVRRSLRVVGQVRAGPRNEPEAESRAELGTCAGNILKSKVLVLRSLWAVREMPKD